MKNIEKNEKYSTFSIFYFGFLYDVCFLLFVFYLEDKCNRMVSPSKYYEYYFLLHNKKEFRITKKEQSILVLWSICSLYIALSPGFNLGNLLRNLLIWLSGVVLICMSLKLKMKFLGFVSRGTSFILCFSLIGWGIYHMGIPLPNKIVTDYDDGYHILSDYFFS